MRLAAPLVPTPPVPLVRSSSRVVSAAEEEQPVEVSRRSGTVRPGPLGRDRGRVGRDGRRRRRISAAARAAAHAAAAASIEFIWRDAAACYVTGPAGRYRAADTAASDDDGTWAATHSRGWVTWTRRQVRVSAVGHGRLRIRAGGLSAAHGVLPPALLGDVVHDARDELRRRRAADRAADADGPLAGMTGRRPRRPAPRSRPPRSGVWRRRSRPRRRLLEEPARRRRCGAGRAGRADRRAAPAARCPRRPRPCKRQAGADDPFAGMMGSPQPGAAAAPESFAPDPPHSRRKARSRTQPAAPPPAATRRAARAAACATGGPGGGPVRERAVPLAGRRGPAARTFSWAGTRPRTPRATLTRPPRPRGRCCRELGRRPRRPRPRPARRSATAAGDAGRAADANERSADATPALVAAPAPAPAPARPRRRRAPAPPREVPPTHHARLFRRAPRVGRV